MQGRTAVARAFAVVVVVIVAASVTVVAAAPSGAAVVLTVTPNTGLVDAQTVVVSATGLAPAEQVRPNMCVQGTSSDLDCTPVGQWIAADAAGSVSETAILDAQLYASNQVFVDCRQPSPGCEMRILGSTANSPAVASTLLSFDPAGALRTMPPTVVSPATDLVDGQIVHVTGTGFTDSFVYPSQNLKFAESLVCVAGSMVSNACTDLGTGYLPIDAAGNLDGLAPIRVLIPRPVPIDCRKTACELRVGFPYYPLTFVRVPLTFAPDAPLHPPTLAATPNTDLADGQTVHVHGENQVPHSLAFVECQRAVPDVCGQADPSVTATPGADGAFDADVAVHRVLTLPVVDGGTRTVDCLPENACELRTVSGIEPSAESRAAITFATPSLARTTTAAPVAGTPSFTG